MSKFSRQMRKKYRETKKSSLAVYLILRVLVIICAVSQFLLGEMQNMVLCLLTLVLFTLPTLIQEHYRIDLPSTLEAIIYLFIFSAEILGEINNFYGRIPYWDTILHTLNGFLCAGIGFSLVDLLNANSKRLNLSPLYVAIVAFCFSMTIGVAWEFLEFSADQVLSVDMQKDRVVQSISSVSLNPDGQNVPVQISDITSTQIITSDGTVYTIDGGYLDIGLIDTMKDLEVNLIGAVVFSLFGYFYIKYRGRHQFVSGFIPKKRIE